MPVQARILAPLAALALLAVTAACGAAASGGGAAVTLDLVAYSTPQPAYQALIAAFRATPAGRNVRFRQSYGPSGSQANAVLDGKPADVVEFSLQTDMTKLVKKGLVAPDWNADPQHGFITDSVVTFVVRKGNPKHILGWRDLVKPGVAVLTPNPFSSGSARWNILGAYGAALRSGGTEADATAYLAALLRHVPVQDTSGARALQTFVGGIGDVLISYENEALYAKAKGQPIDDVVPDRTLLIENPVAVTRRSAHRHEAAAFVDFLHSTRAQQIFADTGYRPVVGGIHAEEPFPTPTGLFTIADLGGWDGVTKKFFDPGTGVITAIEKSVGASTG